MSTGLLFVDAAILDYENVTVLGTPMLFTPMRIDNGTVPKGLFQYEIRHADKSWITPIQVGTEVIVNFYGTLISSQPILLIKNPTLDSSYRNFDFYNEWIFESTCCSIAEYMKKHPPGKTRNQER